MQTQQPVLMRSCMGKPDADATVLTVRWLQQQILHTVWLLLDIGSRNTASIMWSTAEQTAQQRHRSRGTTAPVLCPGHRPRR